METIADASPVVQKTAIISKQPNLKRKREVDSENDDEPRQFRRVRMKCRQRARNQDGQDEAEPEALSNFGEGTIRCICGAQNHYPIHSLSASTANTWLIQCIDCKDWQHRSCVGTANGNDPPSGYYCELCRNLSLNFETTMLWISVGAIRDFLRDDVWVVGAAGRNTLPIFSLCV